MSTGNLSSRQKMINMMYLVLTAMLALNVSAEILKAFHLVETGMINTGKTIDERNAFIVKKFEAGMKVDPVKTKPQYDKALAAEKIAANAVAKIEKLKQSLIDQTDGREKDGEYKGQLKGRDNMEKHAYILVSDQGPHQGRDLKKLINQTRTDILALLPEQEQSMIISAHDLKAADNPDKKGVTWESEMFEGTPLAAVVTLLQKIQNDIKMTGSEVMEHCSKKIYVDDIPVDKVEAVVNATSGGVVAVGEPYEAEIFVAASSSSLTPVVKLNGQTLDVVNGKAKFRQTATNGHHDFSGTIEVKKPNGTIEKLPFKSSYMGFSGTATISPDAMNVLYIGPDNPLSISVPGFPQEQVIASSTSGQLVKKSTGKYTLKVSTNDIATGATVNVNVKTSDGRIRPMGSMKFRVMRPASPELKLGILQSGNVKKEKLLGVKSLNLTPQETYVYKDIPYKLVKATIGIYTQKTGLFVPYQLNNEALSSDLRTALSKCKKGDMISVFDVVSDYNGYTQRSSSNIIINVVDN